MKWNPHQDLENRAYSSILTSLFPEQTKTVPRIICWSIIFLLDLTIIIACAFKWNLMKSQTESIIVIIFAVIVFWFQGLLWTSILKLQNKHSDK